MPPHHLAPEQVSEVPRILVPDQKVRFFLGDFLDPGHVRQRCRRPFDLLPPGFAVEKLHVRFQCPEAPELGSIESLHPAFRGGIETAFHGFVDEVQARDQVAVRFGGGESAEETGHEGRVLRDAVRFPRPVVQHQREAVLAGVGRFRRRGGGPVGRPRLQNRCGAPARRSVTERDDTRAECSDDVGAAQAQNQKRASSQSDLHHSMSEFMNTQRKRPLATNYSMHLFLPPSILQ